MGFNEPPPVSRKKLSYQTEHAGTHKVQREIVYKWEQQRQLPQVTDDLSTPNSIDIPANTYMEHRTLQGHASSFLRMS
jgi:hypothetical protein